MENLIIAGNQISLVAGIIIYALCSIVIPLTIHYIIKDYNKFKNRKEHNFNLDK